MNFYKDPQSTYYISFSLKYARLSKKPLLRDFPTIHVFVFVRFLLQPPRLIATQHADKFRLAKRQD